MVDDGNYRESTILPHSMSIFMQTHQKNDYAVYNMTSCIQKEEVSIIVYDYVHN